MLIIQERSIECGCYKLMPCDDTTVMVPIHRRDKELEFGLGEGSLECLYRRTRRRRRRREVSGGGGWEY